MKKVFLVSGWLVALFLSAILVLGISFVDRFGPTRLSVFVQNLSWQSISVQSLQTGDATPVTFKPGQACIFSPLNYGRHLIHIARSSDPDIWICYYHTDAGKVRLVDIAIHPSTEPGKVDIRGYKPASGRSLTITIDPSTTGKGNPAEFGF